MNGIAVLFAGELNMNYVLRDFAPGKNALHETLLRAASFAHVKKIVLLCKNDFDENTLPALSKEISVIKEERWDSQNLLAAIRERAENFDFLYYCWADTPLIDPDIAASLAVRFSEYAAEYAYADGWPEGTAPELLLPATAAFLLKLNGEDKKTVVRTTIFDIIKKDINSFDIETEISPTDLREHRLTLAADCKRDFLLLKRFAESGAEDAPSVEKLIKEKPETLRTLPAFFPIMITGSCPDYCGLCPYSGKQSKENMSVEDFSLVLNKIEEFADDAVIDISLWGDPAFHPQKTDLIKEVLAHKNFSLIIETCGSGWNEGDFETVAALLRESKSAGFDGLRPLSWIVSTELNGPGAAEARNTLRALIERFGTDSVYAQALRIKGNEDDIEKFYKELSAEGVQVIVQKYDYFCGALPDLRAGDISPLKRHPCRHLLRDMPVYIDGSVMPCRETIIEKDSPSYGNILRENPEEIWKRMGSGYAKHCSGDYPGICERCDEYYTFNF